MCACLVAPCRRSPPAFPRQPKQVVHRELVSKNREHSVGIRLPRMIVLPMVPRKFQR